MSYYQDLGAEELSFWDRFKQGLFPSGVTPTPAAAAAAVPSACVEYAAKMGWDAAKTAAYLATGPTNEACATKLAKLATTPKAGGSAFPWAPVAVIGIVGILLWRK